MRLAVGMAAAVGAACLACGTGGRGASTGSDGAATAPDAGAPATPDAGTAESGDRPPSPPAADSGAEAPIIRPPATWSGPPFSICRELGEGFPLRLSLSADESHLVVLLSNGRAEIRRTSDGGLVRAFSIGAHDERVVEAHLVDGGRLLAARVHQRIRRGNTDFQDQAIRLVSVEDGRVLRDNAFHGEAAAVSADGELQIPGAGRLALVRTRDGAVLWTRPETERTGVAVFSPDGRLVAVAHAPMVRIHRVADGDVLATFEARGYESYFEMVALSADGSLVAVSYDDDGDGVDIWRVADRAHFHLEAPNESELRFTGSRHLVINERMLLEIGPGGPRPLPIPAGVTDLHLMRDDARAVGRHFDGRVLLSAMPSGSTTWALPPPRGHGTTVVGLGYDPATGTLASADGFRGVRLWSLGRDGVLAHGLPGQPTGAPVPPYWLGVFAPGLLHLAVVTNRADIGLWSLPDGANVPFAASGEPTFSADGASVWVANAGGTSQRRVPDGSALLALPEARGGVAVSRDGALVATGGETAVRIHAARDGTLLRMVPLERANPRVPSVGHVLAFSADGRRLAAVTTGNLAVIDTATGAVVWKLESSGSGPGRLALSREGRFVAVASGGLAVWSIERGEPVVSPDPRSARRERAVAFLPDAPMLITGDDDGIVRVRCY